MKRLRFPMLFGFLLIAALAGAQTRPYIDKNLADLGHLPEGKPRITALVNLAYGYLTFNGDSARYYARESLRLARKVGDGWGEATYYIWEATVQQQQGLMEQASANLDTALQIATGLHDNVLIAGTYQTKANVLSLNDEGFAALTFMEKAEQFASYTRKGQLKARIQIDKARIYQSIEEIENAMTSYLTAIHLADSMGRDDLLAHAYTGIGGLYIYTEDAAKLRENAEKSMALAIRAGSPFLQAQATYKLGVAEAISGHYEAARQKMEESLALHQPTDRSFDKAQVTLDLIKVLAQLKQYDRAEALMTGLDSTLLSADKDQNYEYKLAKAKLLEEMGQLDEAEKWHQDNVKTAEKISDRRTINKSYTQLSRFHERHKNYPAALAALNAAKQSLTESTYAISMRRAIEKEMEVRTEKDKAVREKKVALLESDKLRSDLFVEQQQKTLLQTRLRTEVQDRQLSALQTEQSLQAYEIESKETALRAEQLTREKREQEVYVLSQANALQASQVRAERLLYILLALLAVVALLVLYTIYRRRQRRRLETLRLDIAKNLHDDVGSSITSIGLFAKALQTMIGDNRPDAQAGLRHITDNAQNSADALRDIVWTIDTRRDRVIDLWLRMREYLDPTASAAGITVDWRIQAPDEEQRLHPTLKKNLWLIFKEATTNALRYSGATNLQVEMTIGRREVQLTVADNGQGFDSAKVRTGANGLHNMNERTRELGGTCRLETAPGRGTAVRVILPLHPVN